MRSDALSAALLLLAACPGSVAGESDEPPAEEPDPGAALDATRDSIELLPLPVRLRRVAEVAGIPVHANFLDPLRESALEIGGHDFGQGVPPGLSWTAPRIASWTRGLLPVCESDAFRLRYAEFPKDLGALMLAAYGKPPPSGLADAIWSDISDRVSDPDRARVTACLAIMTSLEFVAR